VNNPDTFMHVRGQSLFTDDLPEPGYLLHGAVFVSPIAHGIIKKLDTRAAENIPGVIAVLTHRHIPGENQLGGIIPDEPLFAEENIHYAGQPLALVVARDRAIAHEALKSIQLEIETLETVVDPRQAFELGQLIAPPRTFLLGDTEAAFRQCAHVLEGRADSGGQEHFYLETQAALAIPGEHNSLKVISSTQSPTGVQRILARVLGIAMHRIEVDVTRLGGGFGGKEDQATPWAAMAALAAFVLDKPVKLVLDRREDIAYTGKRHPYSSDYKIGLDKQGKILAYQVSFYQNSGAAADLSTAILERTLFHTTNSYYIPNVKAMAVSCRTNLPPFTAFRGFGGPQAMFVMETAIDHAAEGMGISPRHIQELNLLREGDMFPYGMKTEHCRATSCFQETLRRYDMERLEQEVAAFNRDHATLKKGLALMPVCFGISFTNTMLNQAGALVHVYNDGSVGVSTGAVEMGQGVNVKLREIAARVFSLPPSRVKLESTNTTRVANTSPTAASTGADMNGKAVELACLGILERLKSVAAKAIGSEDGDIEILQAKVLLKGKDAGMSWEELVSRAYVSRINLSQQGYYATPGIHFDREKERGKPFAYHVYGTALTQVTLDCLRGTYEIDSVQIVHDAGKSIDLLVDRGQVEGGLLQGIGWMTMEELLFSDDGKLVTANAGTYKIPDIHFTPSKVETHFLDNQNNPYAVMNSKAVGEPPFMYGMGTYFAIRAAARAFRKHKDLPAQAPLTPEKILNFLYDGIKTS